MLEKNRAWTQGGLLREGIRALQAAGVEDAARNAEWLLCEALGCGRAALYAYPERPVAPGAAQAFTTALTRRAAREPLQYVLGYTEFYGLRLQVTPDVLIPRPETEQVVEEALALLADSPAPRVLDVGTGSGCIALALKHIRPEAVVYACDVSPPALAVAARNAAAHDLEVRLLLADALAPDLTTSLPGALDLLISNPPYVPRGEAAALAPEVHDHEPHLALFTEDDPLLFYQALIRRGQPLLAPGGWMVFETHADYGPAVAALLAEAGLAEVRLRHDLAGRPRIAVGLVRSPKS